MKVILAIAAMVGLDQLVKLWAVRVLQPIGSIPILDDVFSLTYLENRGAAFSMLENRVWLLALVGIVIVAGIFWVIRKGWVSGALAQWSLYSIVGGAIGNLLDRIFRGYVVDLFNFQLIHFPVFNVADIFVCVGVGLFCIYTLFFSEKDEKK